MSTKNRPIPPPTIATFDTRVEDVLRALYWHPMTTRNLLDLNPIYKYPFPITIKRRGDKRYRESTVLSKLLKRLSKSEGDNEPFVIQREYSTPGLRRLPYYQLTEAGFARLFPDQKVPKKLSIHRATGEVKSRRSMFFKPIARNLELHQQAVADLAVHIMRQAEREEFAVSQCHSRNRVRLEIPGRNAMQSPVRKYVRTQPETDEPLPIRIFPDLQFSITTPADRSHVFFAEVDGGTERQLSEDDVKSITSLIRKYEFHRDLIEANYRVLLLTYKPNSLHRLRNMIATAREVMRDPARPLFLFATLEWFLAENGALTRPRVFDHFGQRVACIPDRPGVPSPACSSKERGMVSSPATAGCSHGTAPAAAAPAPAYGNVSPPPATSV